MAQRREERAHGKSEEDNRHADQLKGAWTCSRVVPNNSAESLSVLLGLACDHCDLNKLRLLDLKNLKVPLISARRFIGADHIDQTYL